jgi:hypothetical protein
MMLIAESSSLIHYYAVDQNFIRPEKSKHSMFIVVFTLRISNWMYKTMTLTLLAIY